MPASPTASCSTPARRRAPPAPAGWGPCSTGTFWEKLDLQLPFMVSGGLSADNVGGGGPRHPRWRRRCVLRRGKRARRQGSRDDPQFHSRCATRHRRIDGPMNPNLPNSFRTGPDERGHFGIFGGRFVAETLMPLILDLEKAYADAKADPAFQAEMNGYLKTLCRPAVAALFRRAPDRASRRREDLFQARGAQPHRLAQDQQRARPDPAGAAHGQDAHHRRDRRRPAWRRHRDAVRAVRPRMRRLYGRGRRRAAAAERVPHGRCWAPR